MNEGEPLRGLPRAAWLWSLTSVCLLLIVSPRHGFHRDELYFVEAGRRLDWGFVDQPPLTPLVARFSEWTFGLSPTSLRLLPALAVGAIAVIAAAMARQMGGDRRAQSVSALFVGFAGVVMGEGHLLSTAIFDFFFWTVALLLFLRLLHDANPVLWLALGGVVGIGLLNKHLIGFLALAMVVGLLMTDQRRLLRSKWPWLGAGVALLVALPNLIWQAANGWPQLEMASALQARSEGPVMFVLLQPALLSVVLAVPAFVGLRRLLRDAEGHRFRPVGIAFLFLFVVFLITGAKAYYIAPMYSALLAAGATWWAGDAKPHWRPNRVVLGLGIGFGLLVALPILPVAQTSALDLTGELGETVGWPQLVAQVESVYDSLPAEARTDALIFTSNYGEAGALNLLDGGRLPRAYSGHNNHWLWGAPPSHGAILGVGPVESALAPICSSITQAGSITNPWDVDNEENGYPLFLCESPEGQIGDIWHLLKHYN